MGHLPEPFVIDLRKLNLSPQQIAGFGDGLYQPFVFSDACCSGAGYSWMTGEPILAMDRNTGTAYRWIGPGKPLTIEAFDPTSESYSRFSELSARLAAMYESWIESVCESLGDVRGLSVLDTAANAGYFLFRFLERGASTATGYDRLDLSHVYTLLNGLTGCRVDFRCVPYDMSNHTIRGAEKADIVISTAIMCHLSDPLYYLNFLGSLTRRALLLFSSFDDHDGRFRITFEGARQYYPESPFPICFDKLTCISRSLLDFGLKEMGFKQIVELPRQDSWIPDSWFQGGKFKAFVAMR